MCIFHTTAPGVSFLTDMAHYKCSLLLFDIHPFFIESWGLFPICNYFCLSPSHNSDSVPIFFSERTLVFNQYIFQDVYVFKRNKSSMHSEIVTFSYTLHIKLLRLHKKWIYLELDFLNNKLKKICKQAFPHAASNCDDLCLVTVSAEKKFDNNYWLEYENGFIYRIDNRGRCTKFLLILRCVQPSSKYLLNLIIQLLFFNQ